MVQAHPGVPLYATLDEEDEAGYAIYSGAGFGVERRESIYLAPTSPAVTGLQGLKPPAGIWFRSAAGVELDRLRLLDDELRGDIPGTDAWRWTEPGFREETFSDEFDPATYLVAVEASTDDYVGITRVWMRRDRPRLGFVGVCGPFRRRRIAKALLARVFTVLDERGESEVTTEIDDTNMASRSLIEPLGARRIGGTVELVRPPG